MPDNAKLTRETGLAKVVNFFRFFLASKSTKRGDVLPNSDSDILEDTPSRAVSPKRSQPSNQNRPEFSVDIRHRIHPYRQEHSYSCGAAVMQALSNHLGKELTHAQAIRLTRCKPNGATLERLANALMALHGCVVRRLKQASAIRCAIADGAMVLAGDTLTYVNDHAILIYGFTHNGFFYLDPARGATFWQPDDWFFEAGDEFIAIRTRKSRCRKEPLHFVTLHKCNGLNAFGKDAKVIADITGLPFYGEVPAQPGIPGLPGQIHFPWDWSQPLFKRLTACNVAYVVVK